MSSSLSGGLAWGLICSAAFMAAYWVLCVFSTSINVPIFVTVVQKILRDNNVSRALKLMAAAGDAAVGKAVRAAILASLSREYDASLQAAGYRGAPEASSQSVRERIRARYDDAFLLASRRVRLGFWLALPAPFLTLGAIGWSLMLPEPDWVAAGAAGAGFLFLLYIAKLHVQILMSRDTAFAELWPSFEAVFHNRHAWQEDGRQLVSQAMPSPSKAGATPSGGITFEVLEPGQPLRSVSLDEPIIKIGTFDSAHLQLSAEGVARLHAVIEIAEGKATIIDLGSDAQTRVNGEGINKVDLSPGDVISLGKAELVVRFSVPLAVSA